MTKTQYLILMVTSVTLVVLTTVNLFIERQTQQVNNMALRQQAYINNASRVDGPLQQLVIRMAQLSDKEPRLKDILAKHGLKAKLDVDGQEKQFP